MKRLALAMVVVVGGSGVVHRQDRDQLRLVISQLGCGWPR
jgi:hypothetical protein